MIDNSLISESKQDTFEKIAELQFLILWQVDKLKQVQKQTNIPVTNQLLTELSAFLATIQNEKKQLASIKSIADIDTISDSLSSIKNQLRKIIPFTSSLSTLEFFQSPPTKDNTQLPSFELESIEAGMNDYKRDRHKSATDFEQLFVNQFIPAKLKFLVRCFVTSSGQSALTTILSFLLAKSPPERKILAGQHCYFQAKELMKATFGNNIRWIDETNSQMLTELVHDYSPDIIFLDSLANAPGMVMPDIQKVVQVLLGKKTHTYLILDNTMTSLSFHLFDTLPFFTDNLTVIMYESLNKYYQYGFDREMGGVITAVGKHTGYLWEIRKNAGTIISEHALLQIPPPNKTILSRRLELLARNTKLLTTYLQKVPLVSWQLVSPYEPSRFIPNLFNPLMLGASVQLIPLAKNPQAQMKKLAATILSLAQKKDIPIILGSSFGFDITRIYLVGMHSKEVNSFFRISPGTENYHQMVTIATVIAESM